MRGWIIMEDTFDKLEDDFITALNMPIVPDLR
jgi:hypothetical protein